MNFELIVNILQLIVILFLFYKLFQQNKRTVYLEIESETRGIMIKALTKIINDQEKEDVETKGESQ